MNVGERRESWDPLALALGSEFMPPLYEGSMLYMPTSPPGMSITEGTRLLQVQDRLLARVPEVEQVFGMLGRGTSPTDNSPMGMVNTTVTLKPRDQWRPGMTFEKLQAEMDGQLQFPGFPNVWTQPIRNRLDMLLTGIKTPVGIKVFGSDLVVIEGLGRQIEQILQAVPGTRSVYAERVSQGYFTDIRIGDATVEGSVLRLRPKLMTVTVVMAGLIPIMWSTGVGSDVMKPIAAPIIGGMITSTVHVLIITPVIFFIMKRRALRRGTLRMSGFAS